MIEALAVLVLKALLIGIDLLCTILTFGWLGAVKKLVVPEPLRSVPAVEGGDESHRVDPRFRGHLAETPREGVETLYDLAKDACKRYGSRDCMGTRKFLGWKVPHKVKHFDPEIEWKSYAEMGVEAHKFGAALRSAGVQPAPTTTTLDKVKTPCRIAIFENTCAPWMIAAMGAFTQGVTVVTVYSTLGMDSVVEAVTENIIPLLVCNRKDVAKVVKEIKKMKTLTTIVYTDDLVGPDERGDVPVAPPTEKVKVISFEDFVKSGDTKAYPPTPPKADSCAVVMYTSGSTGKPKGVIVTHRQILGVVTSAEIKLPIRKGKDSYLAYLPLAHILEMLAEFAMISMGCTICYADPKSLSATGSYPIGALEAYSPTLMAGVPKIFDIIKKGVQAKIAAGPKIAAIIAQTALQWRSFAVKHGFDTPFFNVLVFKKLKAAVGGRLKYALSGGGPLNAEVQDFIRTAFGIAFVQGYGLTETCAGISFQAEDDLRPGTVGPPMPSVEVKLESTPDIGDKAGQPYLSTDRFDVEGNSVFGRGEVMVRGTSITSGYYMMPNETKESYEDDGWFHTGDIGQFMSDGSIRIVDRKKNLVKLHGGEYIALEKMEMTYGNCDWVNAAAGGICCYGDGEMDRPVALMQLNATAAKKWAKDNSVSYDLEELKKSDELSAAIVADLKKEHAKSDLSHLEKVVAVSLLTEPWTPENGCLTAANKLQRREVITQFDKEFQAVRKKGIF